jgi:hypothetical protein
MKNTAPSLTALRPLSLALGRAFASLLLLAVLWLAFTPTASAAGPAFRRVTSIAELIATTDATPTQLRLDGVAGSAHRLGLGNNETWGVTITVTGRTSTAGADVYNTVILGTITKGTTAGSTAIVGTNVVLATQNTAGAAAWAVTFTADTTNGAGAITVTGAAATSINWHADVRVNKVTKS